MPILFVMGLLRRRDPYDDPNKVDLPKETKKEFQDRAIVGGFCTHPSVSPEGTPSHDRKKGNC